MNNEVDELISSLESLKEKKSNLIDNIHDFNLLIIALNELKSMVEMKEIKSSIISQVKFLMINTIFNEEKSNFDGHMLHTVLCGPPGCGKSQMGIILAKIWTALGLLKVRKNNIKNSDESSEGDDIADYEINEIKDLETQVQNLTSSGRIKTEAVKKLQNYIIEIKNSLKQNNIKMNLFKIKSLKRELANKNFSYITCLKLIDEILNEEENIQKSIDILVNSEISEENIQFTIQVSPLKDIKTLDKIIKEIKRTPLNQSGFLPIQQENINKDLEPKKFEMIRIVSREDFVGGFLGQTAIKTEKLLQDSLGKVLFIDEAYSLVNDEKDSYGYECLTTLNRFMSEHPSEIVIIFAGYKDLLEQTIFKAQPGLKRRCTWHFEIESYTAKGLSEIFQNQIKKNGWSLSENIDIVSFFEDNYKEFPFFGGDTLRLGFYCKICYSNEVFDNNYENCKLINEKILNKALHYLKEYRIKEKVEDTSHHMMYM